MLRSTYFAQNYAGTIWSGPTGSSRDFKITGAIDQSNGLNLESVVSAYYMLGFLMHGGSHASGM